MAGLQVSEVSYYEEARELSGDLDILAALSDPTNSASILNLRA
jgi:hypothetical protein